MRMARLPLLAGALALALAAFGCSEKRSTGGGGGSGGSGGAGGTGGNGGSTWGESTIYDLQDPLKQQLGTQVVVRGVIVTAVINAKNPDTNEYAPQHFFVQEPEGGRWSGIYVRNGSDGSPLFPAPAVGDVVDLGGNLTEYHDRTQIELLTLTRVGTAEVPEPIVVDPESIATGGEDQEAYEGVLLKVENVVVTEAAVLDDLGRDFGYFRVNTEGRTEGGVIIGTMNRTGYIRRAGDRFRSIVGVLDFSWEESRLEPRNAEDITFADGTHPGPWEAGERTVYEIQNEEDPNHPRPPANVVVKEVVVTASGGNRIWVQEQAGGPYSGIQVRLPQGIAAPAVGTIVTVTGEYTEYYTAAQINATALEEVSAGTAPAPQIVSTSEIRTGSPTAEQWEGVLVRVENVKNVEDPVLGTDGQDRGDFRVAPIAGGTVDDGVVVGHAFRTDYVGEVGDQFQSIVGVLDFSFDEFRLEPRGNEDITFLDGSHPAPPPAEVYTIMQVQNPAAEGHPAPNTAVKLENVVVTAVGPRGFWVQDPSASLWAGIYVFRKSGSAPLPAVGKRVDVEGKYVEYYDLSEIELASWTEVGDGTVPAPVVVDPDTVAAGESAEPYEGMLIEVRDVENTEDPVLGTDGQDHGDFRVQSIGETGGVVVGTGIGHDYDGEVGDRFQSIVGVLDYSFGTFRIQPRGNEDITFEDGSHPSRETPRVTIYDLQDESSPNRPAEGTTVTLENVVVTAVRSNGSFYVSEPEGGAYSGIYVFKPSSVTLTASVRVGDVVNVTGEFDDYLASNAPAGSRPLTEIVLGRSDAVEVVSSGATVPVTSVTAEEIANSNPEAEKYENCLVRVEGLTVTAIDGQTGIALAQAVPDADTSDEVRINGQIFGVTHGLRAGDRIQSVVGILDDYRGTYPLHPRSENDLAIE